MFSRQAINIVSFEFGGCNIDTRSFFQDFFFFFKTMNMSIFRITPSEYLHPNKTYKEVYEQFVTTNFVAARQEKMVVWRSSLLSGDDLKLMRSS